MLYTTKQEHQLSAIKALNDLQSKAETTLLSVARTRNKQQRGKIQEVLIIIKQLKSNKLKHFN